MNATNHATLVGRLISTFSGHGSSARTRLLLIVGVTVLVVLVVKVIRDISGWLIHRSRARKASLDFVPHQPKFVTLVHLIANGVSFTMHFLAVGLILQELGVNLKGYLATASIIAPSPFIHSCRPRPSPSSAFQFLARVHPPMKRPIWSNTTSKMPDTDVDMILDKDLAILSEVIYFQCKARQS